MVWHIITITTVNNDVITCVENKLSFERVWISSNSLDREFGLIQEDKRAWIGRTLIGFTNQKSRMAIRVISDCHIGLVMTGQPTRQTQCTLTRHQTTRTGVLLEEISGAKPLGRAEQKCNTTICDKHVVVGISESRPAVTMDRERRTNFAPRYSKTETAAIGFTAWILWTRSKQYFKGHIQCGKRSLWKRSGDTAFWVCPWNS